MKIKATTTLTGKGQLTIPVWVRRRLKIKPGDKFMISAVDQASFQGVRVRTKKGAIKL